MGGKRITDEQRDEIVTRIMVFHEDGAAVARELGISKDAVNDILSVMSTVKDGDWNRLKELYRSSPPGFNVLEWAARRVRGNVPAEITEFCRQSAVNWNKRYRQPEQVTKAEPEPAREPAPNDALAVVKVLESLKALIQGQAALLDAITTGQGELLDALKALACDLKDNNNANNDLVCQRLKECGDTLSGIKMNTRKKGL